MKEKRSGKAMSNNSLHIPSVNGISLVFNSKCCQMMAMNDKKKQILSAH